MLDFFEQITHDGRPWLILGKGPSASNFRSVHNCVYRVLALNHAITLFPRAEIFHCIDAEVLNDPQIQTCIETCEYLTMPYFPHFNQRPQRDNDLPELIRRHTVLRKKNLKNKILWYNLTGAPLYVQSADNIAKQRIINAHYFSAEAAFDLLAKAGVKRIDTLGIDGGASRAPAFSNLKFENPHGTYDKQFENIGRIVKDYGINWRKL